MTGVIGRSEPPQQCRKFFCAFNNAASSSARSTMPQVILRVQQCRKFFCAFNNAASSSAPSTVFINWISDVRLTVNAVPLLACTRCKPPGV